MDKRGLLYHFLAVAQYEILKKSSLIDFLNVKKYIDGIQLDFFYSK